LFEKSKNFGDGDVRKSSFGLLMSLILPAQDQKREQLAKQQVSNRGKIAGRSFAP
jgi:hypothetical protein